MMLADQSKLSSDSVSFRFGDSEELCCHLLDLVRRERKTATCGALSDFEDGGESMPEVGRRDIALKWDGTPALIMETTHVKIVRFQDVDEAFALAEGENATLEGWRADHEVYFTRNGGFSPEMLLVCERFKLVRDFGV